jgi:predicted RNA-binding protein YlxR (DUF448 family)
MGKGKEHIPIRTCLSCGAKRRKGELIRLVLTSEGRLVRDDQGTWQGRGAYVCRNKSCREKLSDNRRLRKAFRTTECVTIDPALWNGRRD